MPTRAGVGCSDDANSAAAGRVAAEAALAEANVSQAQVALIFQTANHDPHQFAKGVRAAVGPDTRLIGGYTGGVITRDYLGYDGYQAAVAVLASDSLRFDTLGEVGLDDPGERAVGRRLGERLRALNPDGDAGLIYMYDSVKRFTPGGGFDMNIGTWLMEGLGEGMGAWPSAAGMGMIGNMQLTPTHQFLHDDVVQQGALALLVRGETFALQTTIMHGCQPASSYHTVTKADANVVLEIDGRPAADVIADLLGPGANRGWEDYPLFVTLGVNRGDKFGAFNEEAYANRLCMAVDRERRGLVMFEPDLVDGAEVQLMRRAIDFGYMRERCEEALARLGNREPFFALYIDCMGRASTYCGSEGEEAKEIQDVIGTRMPLLGLYTGVELAPVMGRQQALDWTGVLCVFAE